MSQEFHATYEEGVLRLDQPLSLPEQTRVVGVVNAEDTEHAGGVRPFESMSDEEFERELDALSMDVTPLPEDFSRADIYLDHD